MQLCNQNNCNSKDATNIVSMFNAVDTTANMTKVYSIYREQLLDLQTKRTVMIEGATKSLRTFFYGDYEALCKSLGHMGASSSFPCIWCNITLPELRNTQGLPHCPMTKDKNGKWVSSSNWTTKRTVEQFVEDLANVKENERGAKKKVTGSMFHSISGDQILPLATDVDHIIPPSLHILLGLVVRFFKDLEKDCARIDNGELTGFDLYDNWQEVSMQAKMAEEEKNQAEIDLEHEQELLTAIQKAKDGRSRGGLCKKGCSMPICALLASKPPSVDPKEVKWIQCQECGVDENSGWFHEYCLGITEKETGDDGLNDFICPICRDEISCPEDVLEVQEERVVTCKALVTDKLAAYTTLRGDLDKVYVEATDKRGAIEQELNRVLEQQLHVKRQAYHSQCFVGNDCKKILDKRDLLLNVLPEGPVKSKYRGLFGRLGGIVDLFVARFLTDDEVNALCMRCWDLGHWYPKNFPKQTIPPKLHILVCHVPECAIRWRSIGLFSEHGLEALHAEVNSIERVYQTVRERTTRMKLVFDTRHARANTDKSVLKVSNKNIRRCQNVFGKEQCTGRYTKVDENTRRCQNEKCLHVISIV